MMFMGREGVNASVFKFEPKKDCPICTSNEVKYEIPKSQKVFELVAR